MRFQHRLFFLVIIITITCCGESSLFGQSLSPFITPKIDSICRNTLEYIRIKQSLTQQQFEVEQEARQMIETIELLKRQLEENHNEQQIIESEITIVNRHIDSITPRRPDGPRPRNNIIDILYDRLSFHGNYGVNINQLALFNWAAGGENSATGKAFANFDLTYRKRAFEQKFVGAFAFGISRFADKRIEKQDDKIDLTYSLSLNSESRWNVTTFATFNTQFANGYSYPNDSTVISTFFAPAYLTLSAGYSYKTKDDHFRIFLSPIAGKVTFVLNQDLADMGAFGVEKAYYDQDSLWVPGKNIAAALGVNVIINYRQPIGRSINYITMFNGFYNYSEQPVNNRWTIDFNWENSINFVIGKHLTTLLFVHLKYDHNTTFPIYEEIDGVETVVGNVPKLQVKESLGIAFNHIF